jgi:hypothetical protein
VLLNRGVVESQCLRIAVLSNRDAVSAYVVESLYRLVAVFLGVAVFFGLLRWRLALFWKR